MPSEDRIKQVQTTKKVHGEDHYHKIGKKGGDKSPTKFNSETGSLNAKKRWDAWRARKEAEKNETSTKDQ